MEGKVRTRKVGKAAKLKPKGIYIPKFHNDVLNEETGKMESAFKSFVRK